jgi:hypothetical protein
MGTDPMSLITIPDTSLFVSTRSPSLADKVADSSSESFSGERDCALDPEPLPADL